jgi:predicted metalloprotease with PDZ domain
MLSANEGPNYATVQYLLCGLPVVTTKSVGGRDEFYDDEFVTVVDDNADAIADAVRRFVENPPDPQEVRRRTILRLRDHRKLFLGLLQSIMRWHRINVDAHDLWNCIFFDKMMQWRRLDNLLLHLSTFQLGVQLNNGPDGFPYFVQVINDCCFEKAGVQQGDNIISIGGHALTGVNCEFSAHVIVDSVGKSLSLGISRNGNPISVQVPCVEEISPIHICLRRRKTV